MTTKTLTWDMHSTLTLDPFAPRKLPILGDGGIGTSLGSGLRIQQPHSLVSSKRTKFEAANTLKIRNSINHEPLALA